MPDTSLTALHAAWKATVLAISILYVALALAHVWDGAIFRRALLDTLTVQAFSEMKGEAASPERGRDHPRNRPPVAFSTAAMSLCEKASISASVSVLCCGCRTTVMASDLVPGGSPWPS